MDLSSLGITPESIREKIVDVAVDELISHIEKTIDIRDIIRTATDKKIAEVTERIGTDTVAPMVSELIESLTFQKSNSYGEPKEPPKTWREMLVERAGNWLVEPVNYQGKTRGEDYHNWSHATTRIAYLVDKHLQYEIEKTMKAALLDANKTIMKGINDAVTVKLSEISQKLKFEVKV